MTCEHCERARKGMSALYDTKCRSCRARMVARTQDAWNALHPRGNRDTDALIATMRRSLHDVPEAEAKRMVWDWWKVDHGGSAGGTTG